MYNVYGFFSTFIHDPSHINSPDPEKIKVRIALGKCSYLITLIHEKVVILNINDNKMVLFLILKLYTQTAEYSNLLRDIVNEYNGKSIFYSDCHIWKIFWYESFYEITNSF